MSDITPITTGATGIKPVPSFYLPVVLGAETIKRGLLNVRPRYMDKVELLKFKSSQDSFMAPVSTPTVTSGDYSITNRQIVLGDMQFYRTYNPLRDFEGQYDFLWAQGQLTSSTLSPLVKKAVLDTSSTAIGANIEKLIWEGDTASGTASLNRMDGFLKLFGADSDGDLNTVAFGGALTAANIITKMEAMLAAMPSAVLETQNIKFVVSYKDSFKYYEALRDATITKGINIPDSGIPRFAGINIVSCGIPENKMILGVCDNSNDSNLQAATWMDQDRGVLIDRLQANSEDFFIKATIKFGVQYVNGSELVFGS